jgi:hypothetical protein
MASPPPPWRRGLLEGTGAAFQHVLSTASTVTYDQAGGGPALGELRSDFLAHRTQNTHGWLLTRSNGYVLI